MSDKLLRHVVLFGFKPTTTPEQVGEIEQAFSALPGQIEEIQGFEWGTDVSVENLSQGYSHCFVVTFGSAADRDSYLPHPAHLAFTGLVGPHLEKVCVVDYWT
jgi:heme-degrading monooxygenase HmoA